MVVFLFPEIAVRDDTQLRIKGKKSLR
jgi:hypothetical protein